VSVRENYYHLALLDQTQLEHQVKLLLLF